MPSLLGPDRVPVAPTSSGKMTSDSTESKSRLLRYEGHAHFRHRLVLSLLSRRPVRIDGIRSDADEPGLKGA